MKKCNDKNSRSVTLPKRMVVIENDKDKPRKGSIIQRIFPLKMDDFEDESIQRQKESNYL